MWQCRGTRKLITLIILRSSGYGKVDLLIWVGLNFPLGKKKDKVKAKVRGATGKEKFLS